MNKKNPVSYPLFRMYSDKQTFFKIESETSFTELKRWGKFYLVQNFEAQNYADRLMIQDMIHCSVAQYVVSTDEEYMQTLDRWSLELTPFPTG